MAVAQGKLFFDEAGVRTLLLRDPHDTRVRLELARVLFLLHRYAAADYHFRLSAARSPTSVQHNISLFHRAIQAQRNWRVSGEGGIAPDPNVKSAGRDRMVDLCGLPFTVEHEARGPQGAGGVAKRGR